MDNGQEGWPEYRKLVLAELRRLNKELEKTNLKLDDLKQELSDKLEKSWREMNRLIQELKNDDLNVIKQDITALKLKAGMWGAIAGMVPVAAFLLYHLATKS